MILFVVLLVLLKPLKYKSSLLKDLKTLKTHTVNMLNKTLKVDTTKLVDFHIGDLSHCDMINTILSPDELVKLSKENPSLYDKLVACGYTRTVGLLHGYALWVDLSKSKDLKSFNYFVECINKIQWKDPALFLDFHTPKSKLGKCII